MSLSTPARLIPLADAAEVGLIAMGALRPGARGHVIQVGCGVAGCAPGSDEAELERRLLEIGFVEGAAFEVVHEGLFGHDPIAIRLDDLTVALRRKEALSVLVRVEQTAADANDVPETTPRRTEAAA